MEPPSGNRGSEGEATKKNPTLWECKPPEYHLSKDAHRTIRSRSVEGETVRVGAHPHARATALTALTPPTRARTPLVQTSHRHSDAAPGSVSGCDPAEGRQLSAVRSEVRSPEARATAPVRHLPQRAGSRPPPPSAAGGYRQAEYSRHIALRKEVYERLHPETVHGTNQHDRSRQVGDSSPRPLHRRHRRQDRQVRTQRPEGSATRREHPQRHEQGPSRALRRAKTPPLGGRWRG